jgi:hypothetical protein
MFDQSGRFSGPRLADPSMENLTPETFSSSFRHLKPETYSS